MNRRDAAQTLNDLRGHDDMLLRLGADGMSSDEEEIRSGTVQYRILRKSWRAPALTPWLRAFDIIYLHNRMDESTRGQGSLPRARVSTDRVSESTRIVKDLPFDAYDPHWLDGLTSLRREQLKITEDESYDFHHTPEILL